MSLLFIPFLPLVRSSAPWQDIGVAVVRRRFSLPPLFAIKVAIVGGDMIVGDSSSPSSSSSSWPPLIVIDRG